MGQQSTPDKGTQPDRKKIKQTNSTKAHHKRKMSAEQIANKPIDPKFWFLLGGLIMIPAACIYLDPVSFANAGQSQSSGMWIRDLLVIAVGVIGRNPTVILLTALAVISSAWGIRGWLKQRSEKH